MPDHQQMHLRIEEQLHRRIADVARQRGVSASREVNDRLARSFARRDPIAEIATDVKQLIKLHGGAG
jgi:hypothetical protein